MASAHQQGDMGWDLLRAEEGREQVSLEMIESKIGDPERQRETLGIRSPHK